MWDWHIVPEILQYCVWEHYDSVNSPLSWLSQDSTFTSLHWTHNSWVQEKERSGSEIAARERERRRRYFHLWSNFSSQLASNRNSFMNIHESGRRGDLLRCEAEEQEKGGGVVCILPETLFLASSLPLSVCVPHPPPSRIVEAKFSCIETEAWCRSKNRNKFMVRARRNDHGCSIIRDSSR